MILITASLRPELSSLTAYVPHKAPPDALRLDANESPSALDDASRVLLAERLSRTAFERYPDVRATALREAIAAREQCDPSQIVIGCGSDELIALTLSALSNPREGARASTLFPAPSFVMYRVSALTNGVAPFAVALDAQWDLDVAAFKSALDTHRPSVVFLPSPNNPTGACFSTDRIEALIVHAPGTLFLLDEAYGAFARRDYRALMIAHPNVGRLQTLSKVGFAAARVGWAILPPSVVNAVEVTRQPYNLNTLSQTVALAAMTELAPMLERSVAQVIASRESLSRELASLPGFTVYHSDANFLWVDTGRDAGALFAALSQKNVIVRSFHSAGGALAQCLRITVGTPSQNDQLLSALQRCL